MDDTLVGNESGAQDRHICLRDDLPPIPERLLIAHARGRVLFICGAGVSLPANLPDFRQLVVDVYQNLDAGIHAAISKLPRTTNTLSGVNLSGLTDRQIAEVQRFVAGDYDVVLGMLERRLDNQTRGDSQVRNQVGNRIRSGGSKAAPLHKALMRLADRGGVSTIVTTNFDLLLEEAGRSLGVSQTYSLGAIPRPTRQREFQGVLHIHGALDRSARRNSELVLTDQDFGEFYLRRRVVPDFIYDAARLYHLVLVGYSANDPPMRYLLNAVAADGTRFDDLKERFTFVGSDKPNPITLEDWKARGITPIHYNAPKGDHSLLLATLQKWAELSAVNGKPSKIDREIKRIVKQPRNAASESDRDLFDHIFRRSNLSERRRLARVASTGKAEIGWLDAISEVAAEREREPV